MPPIQDFFLKSTFISLTIDSDTGERDSASGFFYKHDHHFYVVTNQHVLEIYDDEEVETYEEAREKEPEYPDELYVYVRYGPRDPTKATRVQVDLFDSGGDPLWIEHPNSAVDVIAIPLRVDIDVTLSERYSKRDFLPAEFDSFGGDSAMALGYPKGLYDPNTYFPVIRDGLIATPANVDYKGLPVFLMAAKMHDGTSGSPVLTQPSSIQRSTEHLAMMGGAPSYLLGIHSGPEYAPPPPDDPDEFDPNVDLHMVWRVEVLEELLSQS